LTEQLKSVSAQVEELTKERKDAQSKIEATNAELSKAKEATEQANAKATELENAANQAKDAEAGRAKIQSALDEANKEIERLKSEQQTVPPISVSPAPEDTLPPPEQ
jgi:uncharacterized coiled-coil DUF342 family protein